VDAKENKVQALSSRSPIWWFRPGSPWPWFPWRPWPFKCWIWVGAFGAASASPAPPSSRKLQCNR